MDVLSKRSSSTCTLSSSHSDLTLQQQIEGGDVYSKERVERILKQQYSSGNEMATLECSKGIPRDDLQRWRMISVHFVLCTGFWMS